MTKASSLPHIIGLLFLILSLMVMSSMAFAGDRVRRLNESNIREFIEKTTLMTSAGQSEYSAEEVKEYLEKHVHDDARFKSTITYHVPGTPAQPAELGLDKEHFIINIQKGDQQMQDYSTDVEIVDVKVASSKKTATVTTQSYEEGVIPFNPNTKVYEEVPLEGQSTCKQVISLHKGVIQMKSAICETEIHFKDY